MRDILTFPSMKDATISLMDINPERLEFAKQAVTKIVELGKYPARVEATADRKKLLKTLTLCFAPYCQAVRRFGVMI